MTVSDDAARRKAGTIHGQDGRVVRRQAWIALLTGLVAAGALHGLWSSKEPSPMHPGPAGTHRSGAAALAPASRIDGAPRARPSPGI